MAPITAAERARTVLTGTAETTLDTLIARWKMLARTALPEPSAGRRRPWVDHVRSAHLGRSGPGVADPVPGPDRACGPTAVSAVYDDPEKDFTSATYLVAAADYAIVEQGRTLRLTSTSTWGAWGEGVGRIRVAFTAGFVTVPTMLKQLCAMTVKHLWMLRTLQGKASVGQQGNNVSYHPPAALPAEVEAMIGSFMLPSAVA